MLLQVVSFHIVSSSQIVVLGISQTSLEFYLHFWSDRILRAIEFKSFKNAAGFGSLYLTRTDIIGNASDERDGDTTWTLAGSLAVSSVKVESHMYDRMRLVDPIKGIDMKVHGFVAVCLIYHRHKRVVVGGSRLMELNWENLQIPFMHSQGPHVPRCSEELESLTTLARPRQRHMRLRSITRPFRGSRVNGDRYAASRQSRGRWKPDE
jgi:hypothetical protein